MDRSAPARVPDLVAKVEDALVERQALLTGTDAGLPAVRRRVTALGARLEALLEHLAMVAPPEAVLDDQAAAQGKSDRVFDCGGSQRGAG